MWAIVKLTDEQMNYIADEMCRARQRGESLHMSDIIARCVNGCMAMDTLMTAPGKFYHIEEVS